MRLHNVFMFMFMFVCALWLSSGPSPRGPPFRHQKSNTEAVEERSISKEREMSSLRKEGATRALSSKDRKVGEGEEGEEGNRGRRSRKAIEEGDRGRRGGGDGGGGESNYFFQCFRMCRFSFSADTQKLNRLSLSLPPLPTPARWSRPLFEIRFLHSAATSVLRTLLNL